MYLSAFRRRASTISPVLLLATMIVLSLGLLQPASPAEEDRPADTPPDSTVQLEAEDQPPETLPETSSQSEDETDTEESDDKDSESGSEDDGESDGKDIGSELEDIESDVAEKVESLVPEWTKKEVLGTEVWRFISAFILILLGFVAKKISDHIFVKRIIPMLQKTPFKFDHLFAELPESLAEQRAAVAAEAGDG